MADEIVTPVERGRQMRWWRCPWGEVAAPTKAEARDIMLDYLGLERLPVGIFVEVIDAH